MLRACGFSDAAVGRWRVPPVPTHVPVPEYLFRLVPQLVRETPTVAPAPPPVPAAPPASRYSRTSPSATPALEASPVVLVRQLRAWWLQASDAQRHVLKSILSTPGGRIRRRRLRKNQRRLRARDFNIALTTLVAAKIATLEIVGRARWVVMPTEACEAFAMLGLGGGRRRPSRRAMARRRTSVRHTQPQPAPRNAGPRRRRCTRPARPTTDREVRAARRRSRRRKPLPPPGTTEWGRHMRALKAAYASHAACRRRGVVQTEKANRVRLAKQRWRQQQRPAAESTARYAERVTASPMQPTHGASYSTGATISAALDYSRPIGRRQRLAGERNRR